MAKKNQPVCLKMFKKLANVMYLNTEYHTYYNFLNIWCHSQMNIKANQFSLQLDISYKNVYDKIRMEVF